MRYPAVELLTPVLLAVLYVRAGGFTPSFFASALFTSGLIALAFIDARHQILPDALTFPGIVLGFAYAFFRDDLTPGGALLGAAAGGGFLLLVYGFYRLIRKREGLGFGDVTFMLMIGAFRMGKDAFDPDPGFVRRGDLRPLLMKLGRDMNSPCPSAFSRPRRLRRLGSGATGSSPPIWRGSLNKQKTDREGLGFDLSPLIMVLIETMLSDKKDALTAVFLISAVFLGFALSADLPALHAGFLAADQATYFSIAQSLAYDHDLEYTKKDLIRYKERFWAGPQGLFLKRVMTPAGEKLYFAKSMAYALFAAPFVRIFGANGPIVFHALLVALLLLMGLAFFSLHNRPGLSLLRIMTYLCASVAGAYALWIAPDFFNLFCVFTVLFLWLYKHRRTEGGTAPRRKTPGRKSWSGRWTAFLLSDASDYGAAAVAGIVAYAKPPNVAVFDPLLLWTILKKRPGKALVLVLVFTVSFGALFGTNVLPTGIGTTGRRAEELLFQLPLRAARAHLRYRPRPADDRRRLS